ncbi:MAG: transferase, partial [Pseudodesulfovibrio sp.]|nr:transferase [Pseudodesulfovibrio sp.]
TEGVYLGPFATADLSTLHNCVVGDFAYVQALELSRVTIEPGRVWIKYDMFEFNYVYPEGIVEKYVSLSEHGTLSGKFIEYVDERKADFVPNYSTICSTPIENLGEGAYVSPYAVLKGDCTIGKNALVVQRAHVENSFIGEGSNAQENCYIMNSIYEGFDVTAHGGKVINSRLGTNVFVGFNSFVHGTEAYPIIVGKDSIVMPHTIIDAEEPIIIPENSAVWGYVTKQADLETQCMSLDLLAQATDVTLGNMTFKGDGKAFVETFRQRIEHIGAENGAYSNGTEETRGHAQKTQDACFGILQPFQSGPEKGMYPTILIGN